MKIDWPIAFFCGVSVHFLGSTVPGEDGAVQRLSDDGVIRGFHYGSHEGLLR